MGGPDILDLVNRWDAESDGSAHRRLAALLGDDAALAQDTLGQRNRRLIDLHRHWIDRPIEAHVACPHCDATNEFVLPLEAMAQLPGPAPDARAQVAGRRFRLPTMADLDAAGPDPTAIAAHCAEVPGEPLDSAGLEALGAAFEALDPLAHLALSSSCPACGEAVTAEVDLAEFVAAEFTRFFDLLLRDIDVIAGAYGWSEAEIVALPPARRARYVALIAGRRGPRTLNAEALG